MKSTNRKRHSALALEAISTKEILKLPDDYTKCCSQCGTTKNAKENFYKRNTGIATLIGQKVSDGFQKICIPCHLQNQKEAKAKRRAEKDKYNF